MRPRAALTGKSVIWRAATLLGVALLVGGGLFLTDQAASQHVSIQVSAPVALADQAITITVTGLPAGQPVTITAQATDAAHRTWRAQATFRASAGGVVNLTSTAPVSGSYQGADPMGLFWSMNTIPGQSSNEYFATAPPQDQPGFPVLLTVTADGRPLASRVVTRRWLAPGESARVLSLRTDKVSGVLFLPPPGMPRHAAVLVFGGAEGGMSQTFTAALLAAHGYPAVTVAYFDWPGLPATLDRIPLEYFAAAGRILAAQHGVDPAHVLVMGYSRGSEAALLLADDFPRLFHGAIVYAPSSDVNPAQTDSTQPAWTLGGKPVWPAPIGVSRISGPVFAIAGDSDGLWDSGTSAAQIGSELGLAGDPYPHQALIYLNAGHGVGTFPYQPLGTEGLRVLGGTRAADVAAQRISWAAVLSQLSLLT
jgi:dienelactone hydrolase